MPKKPKWNEVPCPQCKEPIAPSANRCPHCQTDFTPAQVEGRKKEHSDGVKFGCVTILLLVAGIYWWNTPSVRPSDPSETAKADAIAILQQVGKAVRDCDSASSKVAQIVKSNDPVATYRAAQYAEGLCLDIQSKITAIEVPDSLGRVAGEQMDTAIETCGNAYTSRWYYLKTLREALGGEASTADVESVQSAAEGASNGAMMCIGLLSGAATELGASPEEVAKAF